MKGLTGIVVSHVIILLHSGLNQSLTVCQETELVFLLFSAIC